MLREHPDKMFRFLQKHNYSVSTLYAVWQHHEKINGTGYPSGVKAGHRMCQSTASNRCTRIQIIEILRLQRS